MPPRRRRPRVNRHFKIDHELRPGDREAYLAHLREPRITIDLAHAWLRDKGYCSFSRSAVARHRRHYLEGFARREEAAHAAAQYAAIARQGGFSADGLILGMAAKSEALLFDAMLDHSGGRKEITIKELDELGRLVSQMVTTRQQVFELERQIEAAGQRTSASAQVPPSPATSAPKPEEEREAAVKRICEILDCPYPPPGSKCTDARGGSEGEPGNN
jgi:hypothetical protein